jgi:hypothetical protein
MKHPSRRPQLAHAGVHEREAGAAALPRLQPCGSAAATSRGVGPPLCGVVRPDGVAYERGPVVDLPIREVAPQYAAPRCLPYRLSSDTKLNNQILRMLSMFRYIILRISSKILKVCISFWSSSPFHDNPCTQTVFVVYSQCVYLYLF